MNTYVSFYQRMREKRTYYREQFGAAPSFKAAMHEGKVITTWVGHSKREIVYQGDVLNITARLTDLAKNLSYPIVVSEAVASQLAFQFREHIIFGGDYTVKGVDNPIPVYFFVFKKPSVEKVEREETSLVLA